MSDMHTRTRAPVSTQPSSDDDDLRTPTAPRPTPRREAQETRRAFKTTEFYAMIVAVGGVLIAGYVDSSGLDERMAWQLATLIAIAYIVSRGLAKIGSQRETYDLR